MSQRARRLVRLPAVAPDAPMVLLAVYRACKAAQPSSLNRCSAQEVAWTLGYQPAFAAALGVASKLIALEKRGLVVRHITRERYLWSLTPAGDKLLWSKP